MTATTMQLPLPRRRAWPSPAHACSAMWSCHGRRGVFVVSGQLTWRSSRRLHAFFRSAVDAGGREFRVDLRQVSEVDHAGLAVLLVYGRLLQALGGSLVIDVASHPCQALLQELQLSHLLPERADLRGCSSAAAGEPVRR